MDYSYNNLLTVAGRGDSLPERDYWNRLHNAGRRTALVLMTVLTLLFVYEAMLGLSYTESWVDIVATVAVVGPAAIGVCAYPLRERLRARRELQDMWYTEQADKARVAAGHTFTFYDDRVVRTDLRGETVILFDRVTLCTETVHGFYLQAGTVSMLIRSADLTPAQAQAVREQLRTVIPADRIRIKSAAMACLREPLPLPVFHNEDRVLARASVQLAQPFLRPVRARRVNTLTRQFVLPAMIVYGTVIAQVWPLIGYYPVNLLVICGVCVAAGVLLTTWLTAGGGKKKPVSLAFTQEGLAAFAGGQSYFTVWARLRIRTNAHGIWLIPSNGGRLFVPFRSMDDPEAVRQLIKGESYNG